MTFSDDTGALFREPTLLWNTNPTNLSLTATGSVTEINTSKTYYGVIAGHSALAQTITLSSTPAQSTDGTYAVLGNQLIDTWNSPSGGMRQIAFFLQYRDPTNPSNWITYDVQYPDLHGMNPPSPVVNTADYSNGSYYNPTLNGQIGDQAAARDPRTARWGVGTETHLGEVSTGTISGSQSNTIWVLEPGPNSNFNTGTSSANQTVGLFT